MLWLAVPRRISKPKVLACVYIFIVVNAHNFANTRPLVFVKNFPKRLSIILGLLKSYVGFSGSIFTQIYTAIYADDLTSLILLIVWLLTLISILVMYIIGEKMRLRLGN